MPTAQRKIWADDVEFLLNSGESLHTVAARLGVKPRSVGTVVRRQGYPELALRCDKLYRDSLPMVYCACGNEAGRNSQTGKCRPCIARTQWTKPEYRAKLAEAMARVGGNRPRLDNGRWVG